MIAWQFGDSKNAPPTFSWSAGTHEQQFPEGYQLGTRPAPDR
jgi:hypothetical protein